MHEESMTSGDDHWKGLQIKIDGYWGTDVA